VYKKKKKRTKMERNEFISLINNIKDFYETQRELCDKLSTVFGSDSSVFLEDVEKYIIETVELYGELVGDPEGVDWLFWESMMSHSGNMTFTVDGKEYDGTPENFYDDLKGNL
jgi:hypothetical protein